MLVEPGCDTMRGRGEGVTTPTREESGREVNGPEPRSHTSQAGATGNKRRLLVESPSLCYSL